MSSRILGMGDVLSLIEKAESAINIEKAQELQKKLRKEDFTLDDFLDQLEQMKKMGSFGQLLNMIPGMNKLKGIQDLDFDDKEIKHVVAIIKSMTAKERRNPSIINGSRRKRIAAGSGTRVQDINRLLKQFAESKKMMKRITEMQKSGKKSSFKLPFLK
jgi:signal recognition particle subunit SRP54